MLPSPGWGLSQEREPALKVRLGDLTNMEQMAFDQQVLPKLAQRCLMPLQGFCLVSSAAMLRKVGCDRLFDGQAVVLTRIEHIALTPRRRMRSVAWPVALSS